MKPNVYIELKVKNLDVSVPSVDGTPPPIVIIMSKLISILHSYNKKLQKNAIAVSLPDHSSSYRKIGLTVRFFAEELNELSDFMAEISEKDFMFISKHFDVKPARNVVSNNIIKYYAYFSLKIPKKASVVNGKYTGLNIENYIERCEFLHNLPNIRLISKSNKNHFTLFLDKKHLNASDFSVKDNDLGQLNSYGFSLTSKPIFLPYF